MIIIDDHGLGQYEYDVRSYVVQVKAAANVGGRRQRVGPRRRWGGAPSKKERQQMALRLYFLLPGVHLIRRRSRWQLRTLFLESF